MRCLRTFGRSPQGRSYWTSSRHREATLAVGEGEVRARGLRPCRLVRSPRVFRGASCVRESIKGYRLSIRVTDEEYALTDALAASMVVAGKLPSHGLLIRTLIKQAGGTLTFEPKPLNVPSEKDKHTVLVSFRLSEEEREMLDDLVRAESEHSEASQSSVIRALISKAHTKAGRRQRGRRPPV